MPNSRYACCLLGIPSLHAYLPRQSLSRMFAWHSQLACLPTQPTLACLWPATGAGQPATRGLLVAVGFGGFGPTWPPHQCLLLACGWETKSACYAGGILRGIKRKIRAVSAVFLRRNRPLVQGRGGGGGRRCLRLCNTAQDTKGTMLRALIWHLPYLLTGTYPAPSLASKIIRGPSACTPPPLILRPGGRAGRVAAGLACWLGGSPGS